MNIDPELNPAFTQLQPRAIDDTMSTGSPSVASPANLSPRSDFSPTYDTTMGGTTDQQETLVNAMRFEADLTDTMDSTNALAGAGGSGEAIRSPTSPTGSFVSAVGTVDPATLSPANSTTSSLGSLTGLFQQSVVLNPPSDSVSPTNTVASNPNRPPPTIVTNSGGGYGLTDEESEIPRSAAGFGITDR